MNPKQNSITLPLAQFELWGSKDRWVRVLNSISETCDPVFCGSDAQMLEKAGTNFHFSWGSSFPQLIVFPYFLIHILTQMWGRMGVRWVKIMTKTKLSWSYLLPLFWLLIWDWVPTSSPISPKRSKICHFLTNLYNFANLYLFLGLFANIISNVDWK